MKDLKLEIPKALSDDIKKFGSNIAREIAIHAREELTMAYAGAIEIFYDSYHPEKYHRSWELRYSYQKYYTNAHGDIFYGGVRITADEMEDVHQDPNEEVLYYALHGWHGHPARDIYREPTPLELIYEYRDYVLDNIQSWANDAINNAKTKYKYNMLY